MSSCKCERPREFRATAESAGEDYLSLRCADCGGKAGRVNIDIDRFTDVITNPGTLPKGDFKPIPSVSIRLDAGDSPFMFAGKR